MVFEHTHSHMRIGETTFMLRKFICQGEHFLNWGALLNRQAVKGLKESVITRSPGCAHSAVTSYYEWSQVYCPHLSPFSLLAGKNLNTIAVIPLSYSTFTAGYLPALERW